MTDVLIEKHVHCSTV